MNPVASALSDSISDFWAKIKSSSGECRIVFPAPTRAIAVSVHELLRQRSLPSYLVIHGEGRTPSSKTGSILPEAVTSVRDGSFICIVEPGALSHLQDSISGSGGGIRGLAVPDEWPWREGTEDFKLDTFLNRWAEPASIPPQSAPAVSKVLHAAIRCLEPYPDRAEFFFDLVLTQAFSPEHRGSTAQIWHLLGIPSPESLEQLESDAIGPLVSEFEKAVGPLAGKMRLATSREVALLNLSAAHALVTRTDCDLEEFRLLVEGMLDSYSARTTPGRGLLSLQGVLPKGEREWEILSLPVLQRLFEENESLNFEAQWIDDSHDRLIVGEGRYCLSPVRTRCSILVTLAKAANSITSVECKSGQTVLGRCSIAAGSVSAVFEAQLPKKSSATVRVSATSADSKPRTVTLHAEHGGEAGQPFALIPRIDDKTGLFQRLQRFEFDAEDAQSYELARTARLIVVSADDEDISATLNGTVVELHCTRPGFEELVLDPSTDIFDSPQPELELIGSLGTLSLSLFPGQPRSGPFVLETAFLRSVQVGAGGVRSQALYRAARGDSDALPLLGAPDERNQGRCLLALASFESEDDPFAPVLFSTEGEFSLGNPAKFGCRRLSSCGIPSSLGDAPEHSAEVSSAIKGYRESRERLIVCLDRMFAGQKRGALPKYASYFIDGSNEQVAQAVSHYLDSFTRAQEILASEVPFGNYSSKFALAHLDCMVAFDDHVPSLVILGPWHPMVIAKRAAVGAALMRVAEQKGRGDRFWLDRLVGQLENVIGFRWFSGLSESSSQSIALTCEPSNDTAWLIATRPGTSPRVALKKLVECTGLSVLGRESSTAAGFTGYLGDFLRAFPSRRSVVARLEGPQNLSEVARSARRFLTDANGELTHAGALLTGGIHIGVEEESDVSYEAPDWATPPVCIYGRGAKGLRSGSRVDLHVARGATTVAYHVPTALDAMSNAPRGSGLASILHLPVRRLDQGSGLLRNSRVIDNVMPQSTASDLGGALLRSVEAMQRACGGGLTATVETHQPAHNQASATWTIIPGEDADPAALLDWAVASTSSGSARILWDFRMAMTRGSQSYYVMSEVPPTFAANLSTSTVFASPERASLALLELASLGLALGSESFKSRTRSLGVIGLVGSSRLIRQLLSQLCIPSERENYCSIVLPIDSFQDLLGSDVDTTQDAFTNDARRADLMAILCRITGTSVELAYCSVESKFSSSSYSPAKARSALGQARRSLERIKALSTAALLPDALGERLALARLLDFGMRLGGQNPNASAQTVLTAVLSGSFTVGTLGETGTLLVSTEETCQSTGVSVEPEGVWARLSPSQWPGELGADRFVALLPHLRKALSPSWEQRAASTIRGQVRAQGEGRASGEIKASTEGSAINGDSSSTAGRGTSEVSAPAEDTSTSNVPSHAAAWANDRQPISGEQSGERLEPQDKRPEQASVSLLLGMDHSRRPITWEPGTNPNNNFMITGSSGSGKTQLVKSIITQARQAQVPVLIADFKNDFASDRAFLERAQLEVQYVSFDGLPYNPLIPSPQPDPRTGKAVFPIGQHISGIVSAFQRPYGLGEQQAAALKDAIRDALQAAGIASTGVLEEIREDYPDFQIVGEFLRARNEKAYNRLDPIFDLEIFRSEYRSRSFSGLLERGIVVDLSSIQSAPIQNTLAQLMVYSAHRYLNSLPHAHGLKQVLVFDEAHRVLKSHDVEALVRECRAYGLSILLSSQYPDDFPPDTSANLAAKILHGNGAEHERIRAIQNMLGLHSASNDSLDMGVFEAAFAVRPGRPCVGRTIGFAHWIAMSALSDGPKERDELASTPGIHADRIDQVLEHLRLSGAVRVTGSRWALD